MEKLGRAKMFLKVHRSDVGMFILRIALTYVFIAHSTNILMEILASGINSAADSWLVLLSIIELIASIMILSGFLVSIASYTICLLILYYIFFPISNSDFLIANKNNVYTFMTIAVAITIATVGPGKFVLNKRYGHIAGSLREEGIDKEVEIMGT